MIDVGDETANALLNLCFFAVLLLAVCTLVPWGGLRQPRVSRALRWAWLPTLAIAIAYEWLMPSRFDIRIDLLLLLPAYAVILATSIFRWWRQG